MVTIPISSAFSGVALIRGEALIRGRRLYQCGYPKVRRLFETRRLLEEIQYLIVYWYTNKQVYFRFDCQSVASSRILDCLSASLLETPGLWAAEIHNFFLIHKSLMLKAICCRSRILYKPILLMQLITVTLSHISPLC